MNHEPNKKPTYTILKPEIKPAPKIIFGRTAIKWIDAMVEIHPEEVGFYGVVDERDNNTYFIRDIFYPKHSEVHSATCEISTEGEYEMMAWLENHDRGGDIQKVRFWGHSHHAMGVSPSQQDEKQSLEKMEQNKSYFIRAICNKKDQMSVSFFDYDNQVRFDHIKWTIEEDEDTESMIENKVTEIASILESTELDSKSKLENIRNNVNTDSSINLIKLKIEKLKELNLPEKKIHKNFAMNGYNRYNGKRNVHNFQQNMFDPLDKYAKFYEHMDDDIDVLNSDNSELTVKDQDIDNMLADW